MLKEAIDILCCYLELVACLPRFFSDILGCLCGPSGVRSDQAKLIDNPETPDATQIDSQTPIIPILTHS